MKFPIHAVKHCLGVTENGIETQAILFSEHLADRDSWRGKYDPRMIHYSGVILAISPVSATEFYVGERFTRWRKETVDSWYYLVEVDDEFVVRKLLELQKYSK